MKTYASNLWYHSSSRANLINIVVGTAAVVIATYLVYSIFTSLFDFGFLTGPYASPDRSGIFSFLHVEASDPRWLGMLKGAGNTISVVIFAIALASLLGLLVGVARLSTNPILNRLGKIYVETFRNLPLLLLMYFFAFGVFRSLPQIESRVGIDGFFMVSNRGVAVPWLQGAHDIWWLWVIALLAGGAVALWVRRRRERQEELTGRITHGNTWAIAIFLGVAVVSYLLLAFPLRPALPEVVQSDAGFYAYRNGAQLGLGYISALVSVTLYFGAFIAEIVRGSIQAVPHGQVEAGSSLGFSAYQRFTLIVLPQALRIMIPALNNEYQNTNKDSTLAHVIAFGEIVLISNRIVNNSGNLLQVYLFIFIVFILTNLIITTIMNTINKNVQLK